ncbi:Chromatin SPT2 [Penicillium capsulatum]|uniref:Chromatin SPT2 n=1 Tax=Penicillium capsulatum TaxID=69766 RepID=A0A9W9I9B1_9EURO|nr:Chromatin SPT2 [Penicillium capsulatum]KAJ6135721.1 Chromatin SPT2 [Penicillium capsulatum]
MSFLDSVLSSIQTGQPARLPVSQPPAPPATSSPTPKKAAGKPVPASRAPSSGVSSAVGNTSGGLKRKAEDQLPRPSKPEAKPASKPAGSPSVPKPVPGAGTTGTKAGPPKAARPAAAAPTATKPPPKGSYADLMQRAKAIKAPPHLGEFRNQAPPPKEKVSWWEHKRRQKEAQAEARAQRTGKKYVPKSRPPPRRSSPQNSTTYKGTAKPAKTPEAPVYRGTAGLPSKRTSTDRAHTKRRANEYLGTDEEDEGDYDDYDDHSDASSDMEAGFDDVDNEEGAALKSAQKEDEKELRMEMAAKKEKMERQRKLAALASRKR